MELPVNQISSNSSLSTTDLQKSNIENYIENTPLDIVFIDAAVSDYQSLIAGITLGSQVVVLDSNRDGITQITEALQGGKYKSIHIVSHGGKGSLQLGSNQVNNENLATYTKQLQQWASALTDDADILLYGCNVAAGQAGKAFVQKLAQITGADVNASDDITGNSQLNGNWELEVKTGEIESALAFTPEVTTNYKSILPLSFAPAANFAVGTNPYSVAVGDFNKDGNPDLVLTNANSNNVSVLLGNGSGSFGTASNFTVGTNPYSVAVGDFNKDGNPDLAVANFGPDNVSVLLGNGSGSFGAANNFNVGSNPVSVTVGDFNKDGNPDLAVANDDSDNISVLLGNGSGSFGAATNFSVGTSPYAVIVGDFNKDNNPDLAVVNSLSDNVSVLLGNGSGSFVAAPSVNVGLGPYSVAAGDFNKDGNPDLAVANYFSDNVSVLLGNGSGGFGAATNFNVGGLPSSVTVGDFNNDGNPDLAVANEFDNNVSVLLGNGTGSFAAPTNFITGANPYAVTVGDFNKDGKPDLAVANYLSDNVSVLLNTSTMPNTAPTLNNTGNSTLTTIIEDITAVSNTGTLVSAILASGAGGDPITDPDSGAVEGIAVTFVDNTNGTWQYTLDGTTWNNFGTPGLNAARLLPSDANTKIRFLPNANFSGTSDISFYAWDRTSGTAGNTGNILPVSLGGGGTGGSTAFSVAYEGASITVTPVNDTAPTLIVATPTLPALDEDATLISNIGSSVSDLVKNLITDSDKDPQGIAVIGADNSNGQWQYSLDGGSNWTNFGAVSDNSATLLTAGVKLYDGSLAGFPNAQGWLTFGTSPAVPPAVGVGGTQSAITGGTSLNSNTTGLAGTLIGTAGYTNYNSYTPVPLNQSFPTLDAVAGFTLSFDIKINSETHTSDDNGDGIQDRAGFSVIVVTSDKAKAIELGFWTNEIWAQNASPLFTHSTTERAVYDTTSTVTRYDLVIKNNTYQLFAAGSLTPILSGNLRDYTAFNHTTAAPSPINSLPYDPYETPNFVFFGDNTTSAKALTDIARVELQTNTRVRFVPNADYNGTTNLNFRAWDGTDGNPNGTTGVNASVNGTTTPFSSNSNNVSIAVNPVNDAPVLNNTGNPTLTKIYRDDTNNNGTLVSAILASGAGGNPITDVDAGAVEGIAVIGVDNSNGTWQYSTDDGANWNNFNVSSTSATLLRDTASDRIRFVPNAGYKGTANITFRAWDASDGLTSGTTGIDPGIGGGTTPFSTATETASIAVQVLNGTGLSPYAITVADFNKDGRLDIVTANRASSTVSILIGNGNGTFQPATNFSVVGFNGGGINPYSVAVGDFDEDGYLDIVTANYTSSDVSILFGTNNNSFVAADTYKVGLRPTSVAIDDFNNDGNLDLVTTNNNSNNVSVLLGDSNGNFGTAKNFLVGTNPRSVTVGDFNADGNPDLAVANTTSNNVSILLGSGTGSFSSATNFNVGTSPYSITVGDFNKDGKLDLVTANNSSNNVSVLLGNGNGSFQNAVNFDAGLTPTSVTVGDFNNDGNPDIGVANSDPNTVSVLLGDGTGYFESPIDFAVGTAPLSITAGDFNGDGKDDLATANSLSDDVSVVLSSTLSNNTAPILDNTGNPTLTTITPDDTNNSGTLVSVIIASGAGGNPITDVDPGAVEGIAVIAVDNSNGTWQYSTNGGTSWNNFNVSPTSATLLRDTASDRIRFIPNLNYSGTVNDGITFRAWDASDGRTSGTTGVNPGAGGDTTPFSSATETASISVIPIVMNINEILFDPPSTDTPNEYIELRGTPNATLPSGTYLVAIEGDITSNPGDIQNIFDLSGQQFGSNGFLVLLQKGNSYSVNSGANVITNAGTGTGWGNGTSSSIGHRTDSTTEIENGSVTFFLIRSGIAPTLTNDIDLNNDGIADGAVYSNWKILDSVSTLDGTSANNTAYGAIVFRKGTSGGLIQPDATVVDTSFTAGYVGRSGDTTGSQVSDWVASAITSGTAPNLTLGTTANTSPSNFTGQPLNHIGTTNFAFPANTNYAISPSASTLNEGNSGSQTLTFTITRSGDTSVANTLSYVLDGTATFNTDYNTLKVAGVTTSNTSGSITFAAGETTKTITLNVLGETTFESDETITLNLSHPNQTSPITPATVTILNDDNRPTISINNGSANEAIANGVINFNVTLSNRSTETITVEYYTSNGSATADLDYTAVAGTLTFNPGVNSQTISVPILDDSIYEPNETLFVHLTNATNATISTSQATGTIIENDSPFTISPSTGLVTTEDGGAANFSIKLNGQPTANVTINLTNSDTTEGVLSTNSIIFTPANWNTPQTITITGVDDGITDSNITYKITTSPAVSTDLKYSGRNPDDIDVVNIKSGNTITSIITGTPNADNPLQGTDADDLMFGFSGNDIIVGGAGNDELYGGLGTDTLTGNAGNDIFVIARNQNIDTITDFTLGQDLIALSGGVTYSNLDFFQQTGRTLIMDGTQQFAFVNNVLSVDLRNPSNFIVY